MRRLPDLDQFFPGKLAADNLDRRLGDGKMFREEFDNRLIGLAILRRRMDRDKQLTAADTRNTFGFR